MKKLLFTSDLHGSSSCFQKFLVESRRRDVDFAVVGGDVTSKRLVYIVKKGVDSYETEFLERKRIVKGGEELLAIERDIANSGSYSLRIEQDQHYLLLESEAERSKTELELARARLRSWLWWAKCEFANTKTQLVWINGNDDPWIIDEIVEKSGIAINPELQPIEIGGYTFYGESATNETPWKCPRDMTEFALRKRISDRIESYAQKDFQKAVFVFHCPPLGSGLADASILHTDGELPTVKLTAGQVETNEAGSQAIRDIIEEYKPLVSLHGHIHESPGFVNIGRTLCCNPGSDYGSGMMRAAFLALEDDRVVGREMVSA